MSDDGDGMQPPGHGIAIVGVAGRFPGASNVDEFWRNLCAGVESITRFETADLDDWFDDTVRSGPDFVKARPILEDVDRFDAGFFGMLRKEAELTDPQHRIFLECAWEALEDGGCDPATYGGAIGVFAGSSINTYFLNNVCRDREVIEDFTGTYQVGCYPTLLGAAQDFLATRVSYKLDLRGPSMTVQTACSTSLVAVIQACQSLLLYQSDLALAGGVSITFPQRRGYLHQAGGMVSKDGHCRTFDTDASGTVFGSGAGVVLLKRLEDAVADHDHIYAVIRGCGLNNDGAVKAGFTAPSAEGQAGAIGMALASAGVSARSISFVECHGTATPLGDPIEIAGLTKAFGAFTSDRQFCALGSVKTNIGHLDAAAGVAGLIKAALSLNHRQLPPSLHFEQANPQIDFSATPFFVNQILADWPQSEAPRRAGVSAFGVGGTNAHVILEEAPPPPPADSSVRSELAVPQLLLVSARSAAALEVARINLARHLGKHPELALDDLCNTLQLRRRAFKHRCCIALSRRDEAEHLLQRSAARQCQTGESSARTPAVAFMFPGQGTQYPHMGHALYQTEPEFTRHIDQCAELLVPALGIDLRELLYPQSKDPASILRLQATAVAQPAIFVVEYALAQLWSSWGVRPGTMIGHSIGEFVAATLAGVFSLEDALAVVALRGELMQALPPGAMLALRLPERDVLEVLKVLGPELSLAAVNGPSLCVVSGPIEAIGALETLLAARAASSRRLHTSHAFHSTMIDSIIQPLRERLGHVRLRAPGVPYVSCVSGTWIQPELATSPDYWARHAREPVRFADGIAALLGDESRILVEVGAGNTLATLAHQGGHRRGLVAVASLPDSGMDQADGECIASAIGRLWIEGVDIDWAAIYGGKRQHVPLPTYPFERSSYWIKQPDRRTGASQPADLAGPPPVLHMALATPTPSENKMNGLPPDPDPLPDVSKERDHFQHCQALVTAVLQDLSGEEISPAESTTRFLEMGFDSLFLSQVSQRLLSGFGLRITFRQLLGEVSSIAALAARLAQHLPAADPEQVAAKTPAAASPGPGHSADPVLPTGAQPIVVAELLRDQLLAMSRLIDGQLETLRCLGAGAPQAPVEAHHSIPAVTPLHPALASDKVRGLARLQVEGAPKTSAGTGAVTTEQRLHIDSLVARYTARTAGSKRDTQANRPVLADPRAAAGFRSEWKEMVYPIVCVRSAGSHIWDVDGNAYIDLVNGFGQTAFGHAPPFVVAAIKQQLDLGFAIGPQTPLAGQVARLFTELTGNERVTFCNTGSEAVMAALRVARSVTGRSGVVVFSGSYHGQFDEVLVKGLKRADRIGQSGPVATGIPASAVQNMTVLEYGAAESLEWIRQHAGELAAVVVEPVQSRHPDFLPIDFLRELRRITETSGTAFVMDEVVTGFRVHPGGMQAVTELRADLATYGKVVGGGLPIGVLAGTSRFMDALDGGMWQYGDDSVPEVGVTFFAGTFVRHPLAMAAAWAVLSHLKEHGVALQHELAGRTAGLVRILKDLFRQHGFVATIESYSSFFYFNIQNEHPLSSLLYYHLRLRGIHIHEGFPCFLTTAHTDDDLQAVADAFRDSLAELRSVGVPAPSQEQTSPTRIEAAALDPVARLRAPLTESQIEIWLSAQMSDAASCAFNESVSLKLSGELNRAALLGAMNELVARHDALRATFDASGEEIHFSTTAAFSYPTVDLTGTTAEDAAVRLESLLNLDARTPFDLVNGPLLRAQLLVLSPTDHVFLITAHHIILDGWSMNLILGELAGLYSALCLRERAELGIPASFSEYAQSQWANPAVRIKAERYWMELFDAPVLPLELPTDRLRPALKSFRGATRRGTIDRNLYLALKHAGARQGCTLFVTLLGAFQALMGRLADQSEVVVGIPTAGQALLDNQILVGHCVNFLPLRSSWNAGTSLAAHLAATAASVVDAQEHQDYTLATLVRKLALAREPGRTPLADVQFNLEKLAGHLVVPRLQIAVTPNPKACVTFDLFMNVIESDEGLRIDCDYNTDLFDEMTIDRWIESYRALLEAIVADTTQLLIEAPLMTAMNLQRILVDFNNTEAPYPRDRCMHTLFESQVAARPEATAASFAETSLTYSALDRRANQLANHLRTRLAVADGANGSLIAISVRRSLDMLVALLATLKAGFAYVPLDPSHPVVRQRHILADASVAAMITDHHSDLDILFDADALIHLHDDADAIGQASAQSPAQATVADDLAYVIYTSGSTGLPKGVEVSHRSLVNLLGAMASRPGIQAEDVLLAATTISFDIAALELFLPLIVGARVVIAAQEDVNDGFRLRQLIDDGGVNSMQATPSGWRLLLDAGFRSSPGFKMLCGGEALTRPLADRLLQGGGDLWNLYGPTETTIWSSCARIAQHSPDITAGRPVSNTQLYVLDRNNQPTPCGVPGQLHIGGDGVARRYHGKPALTAEQFVPNPFGPGRVYRTGDLARWSADGEIQILGRIDQQIKLHGYRIEPGEIEAALTKRAGLHSVVVLHKDPGGPQRLACYFVDNSGNRRSSTELCELLAEELPEYMVPTVWVRLDSLPLSPNGKLDRGALPSSELSQSNQAEYVAPATPLELLLAQIWGDVLSRKQIGTRDDLFDLGADSIHIFQITARANRQGIHVSAKQLIRHRNIYDLAKELEGLGASKAVSSALLQFDERDIPDTVTQAAG